MRVNQLIRENFEVTTEFLSLEEAKSRGAMALFGEKYGESVRMVRIGPASCELCGGTHVRRAGDIGVFTILGESAISAGVRRIEALAGSGAFAHLYQQKNALHEVAAALNTNETEAVERLKRLIESGRELEKEIERLKQQASLSRGSTLIENAVTRSDGTKVLTGVLDELSPKQLREVADDLRSRIGSGCIALATVNKGKAALLTAVTPDLAGRYHAGQLIKEIAELMGSRGGGNADLAQAGGGDPAKIKEALRRFQELVA